MQDVFIAQKFSLPASFSADGHVANNAWWDEQQGERCPHSAVMHCLRRQWA